MVPLSDEFQSGDSVPLSVQKNLLTLGSREGEMCPPPRSEPSSAGPPSSGQGVSSLPRPLARPLARPFPTRCPSAGPDTATGSAGVSLQQLKGRSHEVMVKNQIWLHAHVLLY
jgi:hypothetical protein